MNSSAFLAHPLICGEAEKLADENPRVEIWVGMRGDPFGTAAGKALREAGEDGVNPIPDSTLSAMMLIAPARMHPPGCFSCNFSSASTY